MIKFLLFGSNSISCDPIPEGVEKKYTLTRSTDKAPKAEKYMNFIFPLDSIFQRRHLEN